MIAVPIGQQGLPAASMVRIFFGSLMLSLGLVLQSPALSTGKSQNRVITNQIRKLENLQANSRSACQFGCKCDKEAQAEDEIQAKFHYTGNPYFALKPAHWQKFEKLDTVALRFKTPQFYNSLYFKTSYQ